ncbi:MAG TPA: hypothetical protein ENN51_08745 [candidate division WOR-3 bacterium]|mgnify:CR=1 FL=1|uniref:FlgD/Vpr Ig-like domain-containing protein n=1 Tax=candidate division WOR-3 bacterium TaxID=2052148 RepID=A0A7V0T7N6_UNCW3|nr:hypothetical protein [candidate division WOR-3 bacterium]
MRRYAAALLLLVAFLPAQDYVLQASVVDGGGRTLGSTEYRCGLSAGQTVASSPLASSGYVAVLGFWNRPFQLIGIGEEADAEPVPTGFRLAGVAPNPFSGQTVVRFSLPAETEVNLRALDRSGREVAVLLQGVQPGGEHRVTWDARSVDRREIPNGVYFVELTAGSRRELAKAVVAR